MSEQYKYWQYKCKSAAELAAIKAYADSLGFSYGCKELTAQRWFDNRWVILAGCKTGKHISGYYTDHPPGGTLIAFNEVFEQLAYHDKPAFVEVKLNDEHTAKVYKDRVEVGCQSFPVDVVGKLAEALEKVKGG